MKVLKIDTNKTAELSANGIVICSSYDMNGLMIQHINIAHKINYPEFEEVEIFTESNISAKIAEQDAVITELLIKLNDKGIIP